MVDRQVDGFEETIALDESDLSQLFEDYWAEKGEQIIWAAWIEKYRDYISLEYIESSTSNVQDEGTDDDHCLHELIGDLAIMDNNSAVDECDAPDVKLDAAETVAPPIANRQIDSKDSCTETQPQAINEGSCDIGNAKEHDANEQWQHLWNEHCEEQYNESYSEFMSKKRKIIDEKSEKPVESEAIDACADDASEYSFCKEYNEEMYHLGLPTAFGRRKCVRKCHEDGSLEELLTTTTNSDQFDDCNQPDVIKTKRKRTKKKQRRSDAQLELPEEIANDKTMIKYWTKRFSLFSLFDSGIKLDRESWFSVTPEKIAAYTATLCKCDVIVDAFCGAGGNTIQFAKTCRKVIAIDIDPAKIEMAKHNAGVYGVADKIEFIIGSYIDVADRLIADAVFLSPPWGGPEYLKNDVYDIEEFLIPVPASKLMEISRRISPNICMYLPRNSNKMQLSMLAGPGNSVEVNEEYLGSRLIAITAYYGDLFKNNH